MDNIGHKGGFLGRPLAKSLLISLEQQHQQQMHLFIKNVWVWDDNISKF